MIGTIVAHLTPASWDPKTGQVTTIVAALATALPATTLAQAPSTDAAAASVGTSLSFPDLHIAGGIAITGLLP